MRAYRTQRCHSAAGRRHRGSDHCSIEGDNGAVKKREYWGLRSLAYRIKKNRKGHYVLLGLDAQPAFGP